MKRILLLVVSIFFLCSCVHKVPIAPTAPEAVNKNKKPLRFGLYFPDHFKNYSYRMGSFAEKFDYRDLGKVSAEQMVRIFDFNFEEVRTVSSRPPYYYLDDVDYIVEPEILNSEFKIPFTKLDTYPAHIEYGIKLYDLSGNVLLHRSVVGEGKIKGKIGFSFVKNPSLAASKAVENGIANIIRAIYQVESVRDKLKNQGNHAKAES